MCTKSESNQHTRVKRPSPSVGYIPTGQSAEDVQRAGNSLLTGVAAEDQRESLVPDHGCVLYMAKQALQTGLRPLRWGRPRIPWEV